MKSTKESRLKLAKSLNVHLQGFGEGYEKIVICPTCLKGLDLDNDRKHFSAGHILPEACGGKEWTFLCRQCNSLFGRKQDKWFGEYLVVLKNPKGTFLHAKTKSKYIEVNGVTIRADVEVGDPSEGIRIFAPIDENPPGKVKSLEIGRQLNFQVKIPMMSHENEIEIGYITAAYLYWFQEIGYNWVFQSSLEIVRKQIMDCDSKLNGAKVIDLDTDEAEIQGVGIIQQGATTYPCCVVVDKLVVFPVPSTISALKPKDREFSSPCEVKFLTLRVLEEPYITMYDGAHVVVPDLLKKYPPVPERLLYIHSDGKDPQWLALESTI